MGDISTRGKGKALKMKKGGALPSTKGSSKAGMQSKQGRNFLLPKEPKPKRGRDPERPPKFQPRPMPKPRPDGRPSPMPMPMPKPRPDRSPQIKEKIKKLLEELNPRRRQIGSPLFKKDGGEMKFGAAGPMQARPLPITPQDRKRINERKVPNPRAKSTRMDKGPKMVKPLRRTLARRK